MPAPASAKESDLLKKPVNALAIVPVTRKITVLGRKMYNVMLDMSQAMGIDQDVYRVPLTDIVSGVEYSSNDLELIKKHLRAMTSTSVEWNSPTTGEGPKWTVSTLIAHATLTKERGQIWVEWSYAKPIKQELLEPSVFARLSLGMLSQMHTYGGIALYEICSRYRAIGKTSRQEWRWWLPVLTGQPNNERLAKMEYRFFKRDSIKPAIAEINAITDIEVELVEYKAGKSINEVQFLVRQKAQTGLLPKSPPKPVDIVLIKRAVALGISDEKAEELLVQHGADALASGLDSLERRLATNYPEPVRDPFRYLKASLDGLQLQQVADQAQGRAGELPTIEASPVDRKKESAVKAAWMEEWMRRQRAQVTQMLRQLSIDAISELSEQLLQQMQEVKAHPSLIKRMQTSGWDHNLVRHLMIDFFARASLGESWDKPSTEQLLEIASQMAEMPKPR